MARPSSPRRPAPRPITVQTRPADEVIDLAAWARSYAQLVLDLYQAGALTDDPSSPAHAA